MNEPELHAQLHSELCRIADMLLFRYNPCLRTKDGCIVGEWCCEQVPGYVHPPGVDGCIWLGEHGCETQNLGCKLYFCDEAMKRVPPKMLETLKLLEAIARLWDLTSIGVNVDA